MEYLAGRGKIHQIHIRNIRGGLHDFSEVFPDEGEMDFLEVLRILRDYQFSGSLCPDPNFGGKGDQFHGIPDGPLLWPLMPSMI